MFYRDASAAVVCFKLTDRKSFGNVSVWLNEINDQLGSDVKIVKYLTGLQSDLVRKPEITQEEIGACLEKHSFQRYFETSAKTGHNVQRLFTTLTGEI